MFIGILQFELLIAGSESLKDKRRVVRSVKDRLHREHQVSVAEVALLDRIDAASMGLAVVSGTERQCAVVLDKIEAKLRRLLDAEVGDTRREILAGSPIAHPEREADDSPVWSDDELAAIARETLGTDGAQGSANQ